MTYPLSSPATGSWYNTTSSYGKTPVAYYPPATPKPTYTPYPVNIPTPQLKHVDVPIPNPVVQIKPISIDTYVPKGVPLHYYYPPVNYSHPPAPVHPPAMSYPPPPPPPPVSYPPPPPPPAVGQNQHGAIFGDPHVMDPDSGLSGTNVRTDFDFMSKGTFSVLKDSNVALNANFVAGPNNTTVTKEAGLTLGSDKVGINVAGKQLDATLNGTKVDGQATFSGNKVTDTGSDIKVDTGSSFEYNFLFQPETFGGMSYINTHVYSKDQGVGNGQLPTGILGSLWGDGKVSKALIGTPEQHKVNSLFS